MTINGNITIDTALKDAIKELSENKTISTPRLDCEILLCFLLNCKRIDLILNKDSILQKDVYAVFAELVNRRLQNEPVSYLTGKKEFMSLDFFVEPGILIPRPETEFLVEYIIENLKDKKNPTVLDLCTGSGAIAVSIAHYIPNASVTAVDKFDICVSTAQKNADALSVSDRVSVILADVLEDFTCSDTFQCIVSNPPYIQKDVLSTLPKDVKDFEPMYALNGGEDGLVFYRRIIEISEKLLVPNGILVFEIGHDQGYDVSRLLENSNMFLDISVTKDYAGLDRMVTAKKRG